MRHDAYILENKNGQTARTLNWKSESLYVVYLLDSRRVEFVESLEPLQKNKVEFQLIREVKKSQLQSGPVAIGAQGRLRAVDSVPAFPQEVEPSPEDETKFPLFLKYSAIAHVTGLLLILISAWVIAKFFQKDPEPVVVQVFEQVRPMTQEPRKTVAVSKKKITKHKVVSSKTFRSSTPSKAKQNGKSRKAVVTKPGQSVRDMGALAVLGGMAKSKNGSGGLNLKARADNPGVGYGGAAAKGGFERGMLGKGLVATGIGSGGSLQGYGGLGTRGQGGGRPGYGSQKMAGSSAAYFQPLGDESLVEGGLDQDQINAVIQRHIGQIIYCYEQGLQTQPNLSGRVAIKFVIGGGGQVSTARVASTSLGSKKVEGCIVDKLKGWRFPRPVGNVNVRVTYPFMLKRLSQG